MTPTPRRAVAVDFPLPEHTDTALVGVVAWWLDQHHMPGIAAGTRVDRVVIGSGSVVIYYRDSITSWATPTRTPPPLAALAAAGLLVCAATSSPHRRCAVPVNVHGGHPGPHTDNRHGTGAQWPNPDPVMPAPAWSAARLNPADFSRWRPVPAPSPPRARVYRSRPAGPDLGPCWHWRCDTCLMQSGGCAHTRRHEPGTWQAAFCGGFHHVYTEHHPRPTLSPEGMSTDDLEAQP